MKTNKAARKRGRPRGELRVWLSKHLPKIQPAARPANGEKSVATLHPKLDRDIQVVIPKGWTLIPLPLTFGKSAATIGQTARNERIASKIKHRVTVHAVPQTLKLRGKKPLEFDAYAIEARK